MRDRGRPAVVVAVLIMAVVGGLLAGQQWAADTPSPGASSAATPSRAGDGQPDSTDAPVGEFGEMVIPPVDAVPWSGVTWTRIPTVGFQVKPGQGIRDMEQVEGGFLAHGRIANPMAAQNPDNLTDTAVIWRSRDGRIWQASPILAGVPVDSVSEVSSIAAGALGVVAVGGVCCGEERPAIWWSADGGQWWRAPFDPPDETSLIDVAAGPAGFVAVGVVGDQGAIWTSTDGLAWTLVDPAEAGLARGMLQSVVATPGGFLVSGLDDPGVDDSDAAVWSSEGLIGWQRLAADDPALAGGDEAAFYTIVPYAGGLFATGGIGTRQDRVQCENLLGGAHLAAVSDTALSCGWMREMTWRSDDGSRWLRSDPFGADGTYPPDFSGPPPGFAPVTWNRVVAGGPGLVALQEEIRGPDGEGDGSIGIWTSADGATWTRVGNGPPTAADYPVGFAVEGRRLYVLTETGAAWVGQVQP